MNILLILSLLLLPIFFLLNLKKRKSSSGPLPPGSFGFPIIGQSITFLRTLKANTAEKWLDQRISIYGPDSKLSLFGAQTAFMYGQTANKFLFTADGGTISNEQTKSLKMILGDRILLELSGEDHKRIRGALMSFLKPDCLKQYVGKMDEEIRQHLGLHREAKHKEMLAGVWSIPINLPFTQFRRSLAASARVRATLKELIEEKRRELREKGSSYSHQDLITCLLSMQGEDGEEMMTEDEIVHNATLVMVAGHETSSVVITFIIRALAKDPAMYESILREQEKIAKSRASGEELLTWDDLAKMKYTWRVALETLRVYPPIFGGFRRAKKDIEFDGHIIPKDWNIFWASFKTHMDESIFPEPDKFDPDRFRNQASTPPYCFIPFGGGPRICPGNEFARIEVLLAIHYLVTKFTWKMCCTDDSFNRTPVLLVPSEGLPIYIFPRTNA